MPPSSYRSNTNGVTAIVSNVASGDESRIQAKYLLAADGNRSPIRERLGIAMHGHGRLSNSITIYFRADCARSRRSRGSRNA